MKTSAIITSLARSVLEHNDGKLFDAGEGIVVFGRPSGVHKNLKEYWIQWDPQIWDGPGIMGGDCTFTVLENDNQVPEHLRAVLRLRKEGATAQLLIRNKMRPLHIEEVGVS